MREVAKPAIGGISSEKRQAVRDVEVDISKILRSDNLGRLSLES